MEQGPQRGMENGIENIEHSSNGLESGTKNPEQGGEKKEGGILRGFKNKTSRLIGKASQVIGAVTIGLAAASHQENANAQSSDLQTIGKAIATVGINRALQQNGNEGWGVTYQSNGGRDAVGIQYDGARQAYADRARALQASQMEIQKILQTPTKFSIGNEAMSELKKYGIVAVTTANQMIMYDEKEGPKNRFVVINQDGSKLIEAKLEKIPGDGSFILDKTSLKRGVNNAPVVANEQYIVTYNINKKVLEVSRDR